ncbi:MAG: hypothetical protein GY758_11025 [Fuerstiella sp.]|nr:hypothetical protein [Fuerstiella sp.]MCP4508082.1 hypothetical protein [Fuerstiella sp.]
MAKHRASFRFIASDGLRFRFQSTKLAGKPDVSLGSRSLFIPSDYRSSNLRFCCLKLQLLLSAVRKRSNGRNGRRSLRPLQQ